MIDRCQVCEGKRSNPMHTFGHHGFISSIVDLELPVDEPEVHTEAPINPDEGKDLPDVY